MRWAARAAAIRLSAPGHCLVLSPPAPCAPLPLCSAGAMPAAATAPAAPAAAAPRCCRAAATASGTPADPEASEPPPESQVSGLLPACCVGKRWDEQHCTHTSHALRPERRLVIAACPPTRCPQAAEEGQPRGGMGGDRITVALRFWTRITIALLVVAAFCIRLAQATYQLGAPAIPDGSVLRPESQVRVLARGKASASGDMLPGLASHSARSSGHEFFDVRPDNSPLLSCPTPLCCRPPSSCQPPATRVARASPAALRSAGSLSSWLCHCACCWRPSGRSSFPCAGLWRTAWTPLQRAGACSCRAS